MERKIMQIGEAFRGLWCSKELNWSTGEGFYSWSVTFIYQGDVIETPTFDDPFQALNFALGKLGR